MNGVVHDTTGADKSSTDHDSYVAQQARQLDHLFRHAGDSVETRLIYQAVLEFHRNNHTS